MAVLLAGCSKAPSQPGSAKAEWQAYGYELREPRSRGDVNVALTLHPRSVRAACRVVVNCRDSENYYYVDLSKGEARIGLVECGFERGIGTTGQALLTQEADHRVVVKRRRQDLMAVLDGRIVAWAYDDTLSGGKVGVGVLGDTATITDMRAQPVGDLDFADDFTRAKGEMGQWQVMRGEWGIDGRESPSLSANAFVYVGKGTDAVCTTGNWFWDSYRADVAFCPRSEAASGVVLCYRSWDDCFLVTCRAERDRPRAQVIRRSGGESTVLAETAWGVELGQWQDLGVELTDGMVVVSIDGIAALAVHDPGLSQGQFGLYSADAAMGTRFDDVRVNRLRSFREDFETSCAGRWDHLGGEWRRVRAEKGDGAGTWAMDVCAEEPARAVTGDRSWRNYTLSAAVEPTWQGAVGLLFCYLDSANHYACRWHRAGREATVTLSKVEAGEEEILGRRTLSAGHGTPNGRDGGAWLEPSVRVQDGHIVARVDGAPVLEAFDTTFARGRVGVLAEDCETAVFDDVCVRFNGALPPLLPAEQAFAHEQSMSTWAGAGSDWDTRGYRLADDSTHSFRWHRAHCHGDVVLALLIPELMGERRSVSLVIGADATVPESGCRLDVERTGAGWLATMAEDGEVLQQRPLDELSRLDRATLRRAGTFVIASVNGTEIARHRAARIDGARVGYAVLGAELDWERARVFTGNVHNELFRSAPSRWRVSGGAWEVTNRWECDDRWSFFSGKSESLAAVWHKQRFAGDLVVEFYAGIKMDSDRGDAYQYAADINLTLCGDGRDLTSGYSFLFGGWDNSRTAIVRRDKIVAQTTKYVIPREKSIHRHWFHIRVVKRGGTLEYSIDGKQVLAYTDPDPLPDGQLALWTYNNGLMLARVRVSHQGAEPTALRRLPEHKAACVYDALPRPPPESAATARTLTNQRRGDRQNEALTVTRLRRRTTESTQGTRR